MRKQTVAFITNNLANGGIEHFYLNYLANYDFQKSFQILLIYAGHCDAKIAQQFKQLDVKIIHTQHNFDHHRIAYARELTKLLRQHHVDLVHVNLQQNSFYALRAAQRAGIQRRLIHTHMNSSPSVQLQHSPLRRLVRQLKWRLNHRYATERLACSKIAGQTAFGEHNFSVIYNAVKPEQFTYHAVTRQAMRRKLGLNAKTPLYAFFGRLHPEKNPLFAYQTFQQIKKSQPQAKLLMIGYGCQQTEIQALAQSDPDLIYLDSTDHLQDYYQAADVVLFPSTSEGVGMVAIEAQFSGTPVLASSTIPKETKLSSYIKYADLSAGPTAWASLAIKLAQLPKGKAKYYAAAKHFNIKNEAAKLYQIYAKTPPAPNRERSQNSAKNMLAAFFANVVTIAVGFVAQRIFVHLLGSEYLGLNSLFANVLSMLTITELGLGTAIIFNLYKPVAQHDTAKIKSLMRFYRTSYHIVAIVIAVLGVVIIPLLPYIVNLDSVTLDINVYLVYLLFLLDSVLSYLFSYKRGILYAHQKNYYLNLIHITYTILMNTAQLTTLFLTKNYYLYLIIKLIFRLLENIVISLLTNRKYPYLKEADAAQLDQATKRDIFTKIKALFLHQIGYFIVLGSDNIIISIFLGLTAVGLYANYYLIINSVHTILSQAVAAVTPSIGNLLVAEGVEQQFQVFRRLRQLNFWLATIASLCIYLLAQPFITLWLGTDFLLPQVVLLALTVHFFIRANRPVYAAFKDAAGIYHQDRFVPLVESLVNIVASIILLQFFGLTGVFLGTIISSLIIWGYSYPKLIYKGLFHRTYRQYLRETIGFCLIFIGLLTLAHLITGV